MSQKMEDDRWRWLAGRPRLRDQQREEVVTECSRARSEEARLLEENKRQAEQIKALADALWDARQYGDETGCLCWCQAPCGPDFEHGRRPGCVVKEAAIRLAGRID